MRLQYIIEKSFLPVFFKVSIDHSFDNPESGKSKKNIVLEKVWKKSWILDPKIYTDPVHIFFC